MLALATKVVTDYGRVLAQVQPGLHGVPESLLPHSKAQIRDAIVMLLQHLEPEHTALKESLARGYVYLAQFVPDADAAELGLREAVLVGPVDQHARANAEADTCRKDGEETCPEKALGMRRIAVVHGCP